MKTLSDDFFLGQYSAEQMRKKLAKLNESNTETNTENDTETNTGSHGESGDHRATADELAVAIVGIGGVMPGSDNLNDFFDSIVAQDTLIKKVPDNHFCAPELSDKLGAFIGDRREVANNGSNGGSSLDVAKVPRSAKDLSPIAPQRQF